MKSIIIILVISKSMEMRWRHKLFQPPNTSNGKKKYACAETDNGKIAQNPICRVMQLGFYLPTCEIPHAKIIMAQTKDTQTPNLSITSSLQVISCVFVGARKFFKPLLIQAL